MLFNSVVIILREVIEAAVILSVFLALSRYLHLSLGWLKAGFLAGMLGAIIYQACLADISAAFEYTGQELVNSLIHGMIFINLGILVSLLSMPRKIANMVYLVLMTETTALAITLEGSEILVYILSFTASQQMFVSALLGSLMGAAIGISAGALLYYLLTDWQRNYIRPACQCLLVLVSGSMLMQVVQLLMQADFLPAQSPLWDTSAWLAETSITGQLLYAIAGYEATPTAMQVVVYTVTIVSGTVLVFIGNRSKPVEQ